MRISLGLLIGAFVMGMTAFMLPAKAAPASMPAVKLLADVADKAETDNSNIIKVHGRHRRCRYHFVPRWGYRAAHRHRGPRAWPRRCGRRWRGHGRPPRWRHRGCFRAGPVWICP